MPASAQRPSAFSNKGSTCAPAPQACCSEAGCSSRAGAAADLAGAMSAWKRCLPRSCSLQV